MPDKPKPEQDRLIIRPNADAPIREIVWASPQDHTSWETQELTPVWKTQHMVNQIMVRALEKSIS